MASTRLLDAQALEDFRSILRIRFTEDAVVQLVESGAIVGPVCLSNGHEGVTIGVLSARRPTDPVFATYRGHAWALGCGIPVTNFLAELCGREAGTNGGRAGSLLLSAPDLGFFGENSIVGATAPLAVGAALASKYDLSERVAIAAFGDGAMNQGQLHEALNLAAALQLPVVFVCENNGYSELVPTKGMVGQSVPLERAVAHGVQGARVDGNDVAAVREVAASALERARKGGGPFFIEATLQRIVGHYVGDTQTYRPPGELEAALADEPLARLRARLVADGSMAADAAAAELSVRREVEQAITEALASPAADPGRARDHVID